MTAPIDEALAVQLAQLEALSAAAFDGIAISQGGKIVEANAQLATLLRCKRESLLGADVASFVAPESRARMSAASSARNDDPYEVLAVRHDGDVFPAEVRGKTIQYRGREARVTALRDISEQRRLARAVHSMVEMTSVSGDDFFPALVRGIAGVLDMEYALIGELVGAASPVGTTTPSQLRSVAFWGRGTLLEPVEYATAHTPAETLLRQTRCLHASDVQSRFPDDPLLRRWPADSWLGVPLVGEPGQAFGVLMTWRRGPAEHVELARSILTLFAGRAAAELGRRRSDRARAWREAEQRRLELEQQLETLGTLTSGIAHDFNNILMAIFAYGELAVLELEETDQARQHLADLQKAALRARDLVRQILSSSRRHAPLRRSVRLQQVVRETLDFMRSAVPSAIELRTALDEDVSPVRASAVQLHQVVLGLCTTAVRAMHGGPGQLRVRLDSVRIDTESAPPPELAPGRYARLGVSNTGSGIDPETLQRVLDPASTTEARGSGDELLAVVAGIVRDHQGVIHVTSAPGRGACFEVYLPLRGVTGPGAAEPLVPPSPRQGAHILVVDDEPPLCFTYASMLERQGHRVTSRTDPREALEAFGAAPSQFDLVVSAVSMPHMNGTELALRLLQLRPGLPIVLLSGFSDAVAPEALAALGVRALLAKPFLPRALAEAVRRALPAPR